MLNHRAVLGALLILAFAIPARSCPPAEVELIPCEGLTTWPDNTYRWKDIASNLYDSSYIDTYAYDDAYVRVTFDTCGDSTFSGHLSAENLKPNFAYQIKIVGKPERIWGEAGDDTTNENIGYTGRWWRLKPVPGNSSDAEYEANHDDTSYVFQGYLVFDFFITDRFGQAEVDFETRSSYHVLFWETQRIRQACDSPIKRSMVTGYATDPAYDHDIDSVEVGVYAQIERLCYGETTLPEGSYNCQFLLTEESFHESGLGGYWASAMVSDTVHFRVGALSSVDQSARGTRWIAGPMRPNPFRETSSLEIRLTDPGRVVFKVYDVCGGLVRSIRFPFSEATERRITWDGRDSSGRSVAEGVYLYRIEIPGEYERTGKVVLIR